MIIGLTGSFGSGKSAVAQMLARMADAAVIDADEIVRDLQQPGGAGLAAMVAEFGEGILTENGELNRAKLGEMVFADAEMRGRLNGIIHPMVWDEQIRRIALAPAGKPVALMVPLLFEIGADELCDIVVVVTLNDAERIRRVQARDGLTPEQIEHRLRAQMPQDEKVQRADFVICNDGTLKETEQQVSALLAQLGIMPEKN